MNMRANDRKVATREVASNWVTENVVSSMLSVCLSKLRQDRFYGRGIPYYKVGKSVRYRLSDIEDFMEANRVNV